MSALTFNTTGSENTASGFGALLLNGTGDGNTATGVGALTYNGTGGFNTADGERALFSNETGGDNTASGSRALYNNTTGNGNIALGVFAGFNLTTGSNNIDIGNPGLAGEANTIRIGTVGTHTATYIAGISAMTVAKGVHVVVNAKGQLGTKTSSQRFKEEIKPMGTASEAILALKPVTFRYKDELDPEGIPQFGLVAEEVEKINPDLVVRDEKGEVYSVRYEEVNAMLLNEFLKQHRLVQQQGRNAQEQETTIAELKAKVAKQEATISQLASAMAEQRKQTEAFAARLEEQESQIRQVTRLKRVEPTAPALRVVKR